MSAHDAHPSPPSHHIDMSLFQGVWSAIPTPFTPQGALDEAAFCALSRWQLSRGVQGLVVYGTTGEAPTLTEAERQRLTSLALMVSEEHRGLHHTHAPVMVGVGTNCTRTTIENAQKARAWGAHAGLVVTPYYNKPTQQGLEAHFSAVAEAVEGWPIVLYVVPGRAVVTLDVEVAARLCERYDNIVAIKDASGDLVYGRELMSACEGHAHILSGDDPTFFAHAAIGGAGAISVLSNLCPAEVSALWQAIKQGDLPLARRLVTPLEPLARALFVESNPSPLKAALRWRFQEGALAEGSGAPLSPPDREALKAFSAMVRLPLTPLSPEGEPVLLSAYQAYERMSL